MSWWFPFVVQSVLDRHCHYLGRNCYLDGTDLSALWCVGNGKEKVTARVLVCIGTTSGEKYTAFHHLSRHRPRRWPPLGRSRCYSPWQSSTVCGPSAPPARITSGPVSRHRPRHSSPLGRS